jgi:hypothetical protein
MNLKSYITLILISLCNLSFGQDADAPPAKPVYRDAETHDQIAKKLIETQKKSPLAKLEESKGEDPSVKNQPQNLIASSDIISYNGLTTLVPKRAIVQLPEKYKNRINNASSGGKLVGWLEFYSSNRGWITTLEVTRLQAEGREPLAEETSENLKKNTNLIIATYSAGPISLLPLKEPKKEEEAKAIQKK